MKNITINNKYGNLSAKIIKRTDSTYVSIFTNYINIVVLDFIKVSKKNMGYGDILMNQFIKKIEDEKIVILSLCPLLGSDLYGEELNEEIISKKLKKFYKKHNFRTHPKNSYIMYKNIK